MGVGRKHPFDLPMKEVVVSFSQRFVIDQAYCLAISSWLFLAVISFVNYQKIEKMLVHFLLVPVKSLFKEVKIV